MSLPQMVFIDRDGTVIEERGYLADSSVVRVLPEAAVAIRILNELRVPVVLITNQSGIGRGLITERQYHEVHRTMERQLLYWGACLTTHIHCPDLPSQDQKRRKPSSAMFLEAAHRLGLDVSGSAFIGDQLRDVEIAPSLQGSAWLVSTGHPVPPNLPEWVRRVQTMLDAVYEISGIVPRKLA